MLQHAKNKTKGSKHEESPPPDVWIEWLENMSNKDMKEKLELTPPELVTGLVSARTPPWRGGGATLVGTGQTAVEGFRVPQ